MNNRGSNQSAGKQTIFAVQYLPLHPYWRNEKAGGLSSLARLSFLALFLLLSGCAVGPNYKRPNVAAPAVFRGSSEAAQQASFADLPWWEIFHDQALTDLIKASLANNYDLAAAVARVEQADQIAAQARSEYFPTLGYSVLYQLRP